MVNELQEQVLTTKGIVMKLLFWVFSMWVYVSFGQIANKQEKVYAVDALKADVTYLKGKLEANHPNLYLYSPLALVSDQC